MARHATRGIRHQRRDLGGRLPSVIWRVRGRDRFPLRLLVCAREPCGPHSGAARAPQSERPVAVRPALTLQRESVRALAAFLPFVTDVKEIWASTALSAIDQSFPHDFVTTKLF